MYETLENIFYIKKDMCLHPHTSTNYMTNFIT